MKTTGLQPQLVARPSNKAGLAGSVALHLLGLVAIVLSHPFTPPPSPEPFAVAISLTSEVEQPLPATPAPAPPSPSAPPRIEPVQPVTKPPQAHKTAPAKPLMAAVAPTGEQPSSTPSQESAAPTPQAPTTAPVHPDVKGMTAAYLSVIEQSVKAHLLYPAQALRRREQGVIRVRMLVAADGEILSMESDGNDASPLLVAAALQAVRDAAPFPPLPQGLPETPARLEVPVSFSLKS